MQKRQTNKQNAEIWEFRLGEYYGPPLPEQPLPLSSWRYLRDRLEVAEPERETLQDAELSSLAQSDSLRLYLREISRYPLLSAAKESYLAERAEQGDKEARNKLIEANLR